MPNKSLFVQFRGHTKRICYAVTIGEKTRDGVKQKYENFSNWKEKSFLTHQILIPNF